HAASLNPIDLQQMKGYGSNSFKLADTVTDNLYEAQLRETSDFPQTPGRDFVGEIVLPGLQAREADFQTNDIVIGATFPHQSLGHAGALSDYISIPTCQLINLSRLPGHDRVSHLQLAALPYAGITAWSALKNSAGYDPRKEYSSKKALVVGASGPVGLLILQFLKQCKLKQVDVIIPKDQTAFDLAKKYGADEIIKSPEKPAHKYDLVVDCVRPENVLKPAKPWHSYLEQGARYVTLNPPILKAVDEYGLLFGLARSFLFNKDCSTSYALFGFGTKADDLRTMVQWMLNGQISLPLHKVYPFEKVPEAFDQLAQRAVRGKIVIDFINK
ncbi:hypothetical protein Ciccas_004204, partial [Cichlidogyrus casuarinus]